MNSQLSLGFCARFNSGAPQGYLLSRLLLFFTNFFTIFIPLSVPCLISLNKKDKIS